MATITWKNGVNGYWTDGTDWVGNVAPGSGDDALINTTGTIWIDNPVGVNSLTIDAPGATVGWSGWWPTLTLGAQLVVDAGTFLLSGTVTGGTIAVNGGTVQFNGGTLDGVTWQGTLDMSAANSRLTLTDGTTVSGGVINETGYNDSLTISNTPALDGVTINVGGDGASLTFDGTVTYDNATLNIGDTTGSSYSVYNRDPAGAGAVLTFGPNLTVNQAGYSVRIDDGSSWWGANPTETFDNKGVINADVSGGQFIIREAKFINDGTIVAGNGDTVYIEPYSNFTNNGIINVSDPGTVLYLGLNGVPWTNAGQVNIGAGAAVHLTGLFTAADLAGFHVASGGTLYLDTSFDNTGGTVAIAPDETLVLNGKIAGGTIQDPGAGLVSQGGTLDGVTYQGTIDLSRGGTLFLADSLSMTGAGGSGAGTINVTGYYAYLYALNNVTLDNAVVNIGPSGSSYAWAPDYLYNGDTTGTGAILTLGPNLTINQTGQYVQLTGSGYAGDGIHNQGLINAAYAGGQFYISDSSFTNDGSIVVGNGDGLYIQSGTFTNNGLITVTGAGSLLYLADSLSGSQLGTIVTTNGGAVAITGRITSGTIAAGNTDYIGSGGTLDGVTYQGTIDLSRNYASLWLANSLTMTGAGGTGTGTINLTGYYAYLHALNTFTLDNAVVNFGNAYGAGDYLYNDDQTGVGAVLTFGTGVTVNQTGQYVQFMSTGYASDGFDNKGLINATYAGGQFQIYGPNFTNEGSIVVGNGDTLYLHATNFANTGLITVTGSGSVLSLAGSFSGSQLGTIVTSNGGAVGITGTITGGTIAAGNTDYIGSGGTLDGVTYQGTIDLSRNYASLWLADSVTMTGAGGSGAGTINLTGYYAYLYAWNNFTLDNAVVNFGNAGWDVLYNYDPTNVGAILTLGPKLTVNQTGQYVQFAGSGNTGDGIDNKGLINAAFAGGQFYIYDRSFTNDGSIAVSHGDTLYIDSSSFTNTGAISVTGAGSRLYLGQNGSAWTNAGQISIGAGASVYLAGTFTATDLTGIHVASGGALYINGTLDNPGTLAVGPTGLDIASGGTLTVNGTLENSGTLVLGPGHTYQKVILPNGGTILGGTIQDGGAGLLAQGGTLSAVTYQGTLNLSQVNAYLTLDNGTTVVGAGGVGPGLINESGYQSRLYITNTPTLSGPTINETGNNARLYFGGTITYDNATLNVGSSGGINFNVENFDTSTVGGSVLTLGPNLTVNQKGQSVQFSTSAWYSSAGDGIDNKGLINATYAGGQFTINPANFTNDGSIVVGNGDTLTIQPSGSFTNTGSISVTGATLMIQPSGSFTNTGAISITGASSGLWLYRNSNPWTNNGQINASAGATVHLEGNYTTAELGAFNLGGGGTLIIDGTLDNTGATLSIAPGGTVVVTGRIIGGTIADPGAGLVGQNGTLDGVAYQGGGMNIVAGGATLTLADGTTLSGTGGTGPGVINETGYGDYVFVTNTPTLSGVTINLTGPYDLLYFVGGGTFDNATLNIGGSNHGYNFLNNYATSGGVLTLGPNLTVNQTGYGVQISDSGTAGDGIDNQGLINASYAGGQFYIFAVNFISDGSIIVSNGDNLYIQATTFTNLSGNTLTGGTYVVGAGSGLNLGNTGAVVTLNADLTLTGVGSHVTSSGQQIETTLTAIGTSGALRVLGGRDYITSNTIDNFGTLQLGGGTFDPPPITIETGGTLFGFGTVDAQVIDNGLIEANGGLLDLTQGATGSGTIQVDAGATLELGAPLDPNIVLQVESGSGIDLATLAYADGGTVSLDPTTNVLTVKIGGQTYQQTLTGDYTGKYFHLAKDASGGTQVTMDEVACFLAGTLIRTPDGERAVEKLAIGDLVLTTAGAAMPVLWIGRQTVSRVFADPLRVLPIRITAGALDENMPVRDLLLSPDHALLVDGVLIQAGALVNGTTIRREQDVPEIYTYYHIELADHSLILADGVPAETFVDNVDRMGFDNWDEYLALYPEGREVAEMWLPRAKAHRQVPMATRRRLALRAAAHPGAAAA